MSGWRARRHLAVAIALGDIVAYVIAIVASGFAASFWLVPFTGGERWPRIVGRHGTRIVTMAVTIPGRHAAKVTMT
ncbi:MAG: hypothetical protein M3067_06600 [Chloroflexota bacterium]|nr:hypothetical protein [Chloroflexota bacterium]